MSDLIDTTEMYLRTIYELEEEGVVPLRARIAQRLNQSGPTVSQTVARMERDGLLHVAGDRHLELTDHGRLLASRVMRKHRLAECLLTEVIGLPWEDVHTEACRWEHVMSDAVEVRIWNLLSQPSESPYGNPIPGLDELTGDPSIATTTGRPPTLVPLTESSEPNGSHLVRRLGEPLQSDPTVMTALAEAGISPGATITCVLANDACLLTGPTGATITLPHELAAHVVVEVAGS